MFLTFKTKVINKINWINYLISFNHPNEAYNYPPLNDEHPLNLACIYSNQRYDFESFSKFKASKIDE